MVVEERAKKVSSALKEWFTKTSKTETTPNDIILYLIEKGIYKQRRGAIALQLRNDLRKLFEKNQLDLIEGAYYVQKKKNKNWYFRKQ